MDVKHVVALAAVVCLVFLFGGYYGGYFVGRKIHSRSPVDCEWQNWNQWSDCSHECGTNGTQYRIRSYSLQAKDGGIECHGNNSEEERCNLMCSNGGTPMDELGYCNCLNGFTGTCCECTIQNCSMTEWNGWSTCSHACGPHGTQFRIRKIVQAPECGGSECTSSLTEEQSCGRKCYNGGSIENNSCKCPSGYSGQCCECEIKHCELSEWSEWSLCSQTCGPSGTRFRIRDILQSPECGGMACSSILSEQQPCNRTCYNGGSLIVSEKTCRCSDGFTGQCCEIRTQDCALIPWGQWSSCSHTCGPLGKRFRIREMLEKRSECGQTILPSLLSEDQACNQACLNGGTISESRCDCPIGYNGTCCECKIQDCVLNAWSEWSTCSERCGALGTRFRTRNVDKFQECGGAKCSFPLTAQQPCNRICSNGGRLVDHENNCSCPDGFRGQCCDIKVQDCAMSSWNQWSSCSHSCGPLGKQFRTRDIDRSSACGGQTMFPSFLSEEQSCNTFCLNSGKLIENRCDCPIGYSGTCCECKIQDCVMDAWSEWSACSKKCGPLGKQFRTRNVIKEHACGGVVCPNKLTDQTPCNQFCNNSGTMKQQEDTCSCQEGFSGDCCECENVDCSHSEWSDWSSCKNATLQNL
ncbi:neurogenic locus notch homolog protein 1-like [Anneissia japonica]|uniref:neurogenic locus notch homolog protein 1-like n=1 Tax=Anneissia japonica TaxID=1529436 RepID=UPI0014254B30|nr:neurogenic locus notch homolog protein 1-like [Anneissia japonica]